MSEKVELAKAKRKKRIENIKKDIKSGVSKLKSGPQKNVAVNKLELLITVVNRHKAEFYSDLIQSFDVNMQLIALAHGTANAKMLDYIGLTDTEKTVIFSVMQEGRIPDALNTLESKFKSIKGGGIAFTIPLTSVIGTLIFRFLSDNRIAVKESR